MTLSTIVIYVAIAAILLTLITYFGFGKKDHPVMSYVQNYVGAFFIFSGWVKAVDPLGTAYKMQDYFNQFEFVFEETWFSFITPIFPILTDYAIGFSVFVIVFEIVLGAMLILGHKPKFTAWALLILVIFFTILTGFTYLTGYVPGDVNFFSFSSWGEFNENNMKVTDCGCFGDFIKLEPFVSFQKDLVLLVPAFFFLFKSKNMHTLFSKTIRNVLVTLTTLGLTYFCISNFLWDIPDNDFRPFKKGVNIAAQKKLEEDAVANVQITEAVLTNKASEEVTILPYNQYLSVFKDYPKEEWSLDYNQTEPTVPHSKISEFAIADEEGYALDEEILGSEAPIIMLVAHKLYGDASPSTRIVKDTTYRMDTIFQRDGSMITQKAIASVDERTEDYIDYLWKDYYTERYDDVIKPFVEAAQAEGLKVVLAAGGDFERINDFKNDMRMDIKYGEADDLLLKTIVRSNPGVVLMQGGKLLDKWHYKQLPKFKEVKESYLQ